MTLTDQQISDAKNALKLEQPHHEHDDCIRMAYEWLDAQTKIQTKRQYDWKHLIEHWCGRHITDDDMRVAAHIHPEVQREGEKLNLGKRLILPNFERLDGIGEAHSQVPVMADYRKRIYAALEN